MSLIPEELAAIIVCPACRGDLDEDAAASRLVCRGCGRGYRVEDGIPILLVEEAEPPDASGRTEARRPPEDEGA